MSGIQIIVQRDSVSNGDDANAPNEYRFWLSDDAKLFEVFKELASSGYLPSIGGFNESWEAKVNEVLVCSFGKNIENPKYFIEEKKFLKEIGAPDNYLLVYLSYFSALN
jgi:hypothetical protein